jgi:hypothetical protein
MGHKGPVLRPRCIGTGGAGTQIPFIPTFVVRGVKLDARDMRVMLNVCTFSAKSAFRKPYYFVSINVIKFTRVPSISVTFCK